jgi:hypothetical protein
MVIPPFIKRRVVEIDSYITQRLIDHPYYFVSQHVEGYLNRITRDLSEWFIQTYGYRPDSDESRTEYYKKVNELIPIIKYMIRTKVIVHWEKMNGVKHPELS